MADGMIILILTRTHKMMKEIILETPELIILNDYINAERKNKYFAAKLKKDFTEIVRLKALRLDKIEKIEKITFMWVEINKRRDPDNISFGQKFVFDGLQTAKVIKNDGWKLWKNNPIIIHKFRIGDKRSCIVAMEL